MILEVSGGFWRFPDDSGYSRKCWRILEVSGYFRRVLDDSGDLWMIVEGLYNHQ